jgi:glucose-1-phosphate thymidylyltransferase
MIDHGARIKAIDVEGWFDAGKLGTLLETNRIMLERGRARRPTDVPGSTIVDPVYIEDGVAIRRSRVGPNVSLGTGTVIEDSEIRDSIVGERTHVRNSHLANSLIGDHVWLDGVRGEGSVGDHSEVRVTGGSVDGGSDSDT